MSDERPPIFQRSLPSETSGSATPGHYRELVEWLRGRFPQGRYGRHSRIARDLLHKVGDMSSGTLAISEPSEGEEEDALDTL